ncbi:hypothetical protein IWQ61_010261, partial [Dispira simplex]
MLRTRVFSRVSSGSSLCKPSLLANRTIRTIISCSYLVHARYMSTEQKEKPLDSLVVGLGQSDNVQKSLETVLPKSLAKDLEHQIKAAGVKGKSGECKVLFPKWTSNDTPMLTLPLDSTLKVALVGLGTGDETLTVDLQKEKLRRA